MVGEVKRNLGREVLGIGRVQREWIGILRVVGGVAGSRCWF